LLFRKYIGQKAWRAIHFASFGLFWVIVYHGIKTGTDITSPWVKAMYISTGTIVAFLFLLRLQKLFIPLRKKRNRPKTSSKKIRQQR